MVFKKGDFLTIDYVASVKETGEIFDTTLEEVAKREGLHKEGEIYEPKLVVVGEGWVLKAIDDKLPSLNLKKQERIEIRPDQAFGPRDPEKLKLVPLRRIRDKGITPKLGMRVEYDNKLATIRTMGGGRVQLDFNPPLAGKTLIYEITPKRLLRTRKNKILALIHRRIPAAETSKFTLSLTAKRVQVYVPETAFYIEGIQLAKRGIAADIQKFFSTLNVVEFTETFKSLGTEITPNHVKKRGRKKQPKKSKAS